MLYAFFSTRAGKAVLIGLALLLAAVAFALWLRGERREAVEADRAAASAEALSKAAEAQERGADAARESAAGIEAGNTAARDAARDSDDPLKAGLEELRNRQR
jgi:hypothetical protein